MEDILLIEMMKTIDRAAARGAMHKNTAARKMSRLASRVKAIN